MLFESSSDQQPNTRSPGGFEFGVQGWVWGPPRPTSITFFLDGSAMVCDQYGRPIRRALTSQGELRFADKPPDDTRDGPGATRNSVITPRPHFATHAQVLAALAEERINWLGYEVRSIDSQGRRRAHSGLTFQEAAKVQARLVQDGNRDVTTVREIVCAGWPQLPYEELKKLPEIPPTPTEELRRIRDPQLRKDALRMRGEMDESYKKETAGVAKE